MGAARAGHPGYDVTTADERFHEVPIASYRFQVFHDLRGYPRLSTHVLHRHI
jgi:hypothetical protein